eukprot:TRINITY_DN2364_c2_g1_i1.p1 TRINITY_DN2364_c2_g1~~TRINITY_DN2364_c2_g1_i1.p1  ORF type:complete len:416 (+),score=62.71 TRINITY_DN2364_c2_g1_i1:75-1322(+)
MPAMLPGVVCMVLSLSYQINISKTGELFPNNAWESAWYGSGSAMGSDHLWMDGMLMVTQDPVMIRLIGKNASKKMEEGIDGVMGIFDAKPGTVIGSILGAKSTPKKIHDKNYHGLFLGNEHRQGLFQYEGYDTGTFFPPTWVSHHPNCRSKSYDCYGALKVSGVFAYGVGSSKVAKEVSVVTKVADDSPFGGMLKSLVRSIMLPTKMYEEYQKVANESLGLKVTFTGGGVVKIPNKYLVVTKTSGSFIILGQPLFKMVNVVIETGRRGLRKRIGISHPRKRVSETDEFMAAPVRITESGLPVTDIGVGGPWGPVQTGFTVVLDTATNDIALRSGSYENDPVYKPYLGSFRHSVLVFLCLCPIIISVVLKEANRAAAASPRHAPHDIGEDDSIEMADGPRSPQSGRSIKSVPSRDD